MLTSEARETLVRKLKSKYGVVQTIAWPKARGTAVLLRRYLMRGNQLFSRSNECGCLFSAILNWLRDLKEEDVEIAVGERIGHSVDISFASKRGTALGCQGGY